MSCLGTHSIPHCSARHWVRFCGSRYIRCILNLQVSDTYLGKPMCKWTTTHTRIELCAKEWWYLRGEMKTGHRVQPCMKPLGRCPTAPRGPAWSRSPRRAVSLWFLLEIMLLDQNPCQGCLSMDGECLVVIWGKRSDQVF